MVRALHEAHRVLKPNGLMIDLRPAPVHRSVGIARGGRYRHLGTMREKFDDDRAADRAVAQVVRQGLFKAGRQTRFDCRRVMDTLAEFQAWVDEFAQLADLPPHDWLVHRVERALKTTGGRGQIVVRGPLKLRLLRRLDDDD